MSAAVHSNSQTVEEVGTVKQTVERAMVVVVQKMGSGKHASRQHVKVQVQWSFDELVNKIIKGVTPQLKHEDAIGKQQVKLLVGSVTKEWCEAGILCHQHGMWCFRLFKLDVSARKTKEPRSSTSQASPRYVNRPQQHTATV